jgi:3-hydroxyisobutyrate dehydrogenase
VQNVRELLEIYSVEVQHMGTCGAGQHTKMANQMMIASTMVGLCESLLYAQKAGLNHD